MHYVLGVDNNYNNIKLNPTRLTWLTLYCTVDLNSIMYDYKSHDHDDDFSLTMMVMR